MPKEKVISPFLDPRWRWSSKYSVWMCDNEDDIICPRCHSEHPAVKGPTSGRIIEVDEKAQIVGRYNSDGSVAVDTAGRLPRFNYVDLSKSDSSIYSFCGKIRVRKKQYECRCIIFAHTSDEYLKHDKLRHFPKYLRYSQYIDFCKAVADTASSPQFIDNDAMLYQFRDRTNMQVAECNNIWLQEFPDIDIKEEFRMHTMLYDFLEYQIIKHRNNDKLLSVLERLIGPPDDNSEGIRRPLLELIQEAILKESYTTNIKR